MVCSVMGFSNGIKGADANPSATTTKQLSKLGESEAIFDYGKKFNISGIIEKQPKVVSGLFFFP